MPVIDQRDFATAERRERHEREGGRVGRISARVPHDVRIHERNVRVS